MLFLQVSGRKNCEGLPSKPVGPSSAARDPRPFCKKAGGTPKENSLSKIKRVLGLDFFHFFLYPKMESRKRGPYEFF